MLHRLASDLRFRLRALLRRDAESRELDDELAFHLEQATRKHVASGMTPQAAARQARLEFGGVRQIREDTREAHGVSLVESFGQDLRYALRTTDYFRTMGTRILRGRGFEPTDGEGAPPVVVVSEGMARAVWPDRDPIGQCMRMGDAAARCTTVIGVAEEARLNALSDPREFAYYLLATQLGEAAGPAMFVRVSGDPGALVIPLRRRLQLEMPGIAYVNVVPLSQLVDPAFRAWQFGATMFVAFGVLALALASVGLYSLLSYDVAQRRQELGVRLALGASSGRVVWLVVSVSLKIVLAGLAIGVALAVVAGRWLQSLMFGVSARDPLVLGGVMAALMTVAAAASLAPAWRATRVDPNAFLRSD